VSPEARGIDHPTGAPRDLELETASIADHLERPSHGRAESTHQRSEAEGGDAADSEKAAARQSTPWLRAGERLMDDRCGILLTAEQREIQDLSVHSDAEIF
jgi:hypothetical protein